MDVLQPQKIIHSQLFGSVIKPAGAHVDSTPPVTEGVTLDVHADPYQQAMEYAEQFGQPTNHTYFREESVNPSLDKIKGKMQAAMREFNHSEDLVHALSRKKRSLPVTVEDGRAHIHALNDVINNIHSGYQKQYGEIIKKATEYMQNINTSLGKINKYISSGNDGKIFFKKWDYASELNRDMAKYSNFFRNNPDMQGHLPASFYGTWSPSEVDTLPIASIEYNPVALQFWEKKLGGQGFSVKRVNNEIQILPDLKPVRAIFSTIAGVTNQWSGYHGSRIPKYANCDR